MLGTLRTSIKIFQQQMNRTLGFAANVGSLVCSLKYGGSMHTYRVLLSPPAGFGRRLTKLNSIQNRTAVRKARASLTPYIDAR